MDTFSRAQAFLHWGSFQAEKRKVRRKFPDSSVEAKGRIKVIATAGRQFVPEPPFSMERSHRRRRLESAQPRLAHRKQPRLRDDPRPDPLVLGRNHATRNPADIPLARRAGNASLDPCRSADSR